MTPFLPLFVDLDQKSGLTLAEMYLEHIFPNYTRSHTEQALQGNLDVLAPCQRGPQFHPQPWVPVVRADRLEADGEQVIDRENARGSGPLLVAECLDRAHAATREVLGHALDEHAPETAAGELAEDARGHQQHSIRAHRARRKGDRPRHVLRRREKHIRRWDPVDVEDLPATAPLEQYRGDPGLLFQRWIIGLGTGLAHRIEFPEDAGTAAQRKIAEIIQCDVDKSARHPVLFPDHRSA